MKKILVALAVSSLFVTGIFAVGLREVTGVEWATAPASVAETLKQRRGVTLASQTADRITFKGGVVARMPVRQWEFDFQKGKLAKVSISFRVRQGSDAKGFLANQDFAKLRVDLERTDGSSKLERGKNFEAATWRLAKSAETMRLHHGWTLGVKDSSTMDLTFSPRG